METKIIAHAYFSYREVTGKNLEEFNPLLIPEKIKSGKVEDARGPYRYNVVDELFFPKLNLSVWSFYEQSDWPVVIAVRGDRKFIGKMSILDEWGYGYHIAPTGFFDAATKKPAALIAWEMGHKGSAKLELEVRGTEDKALAIDLVSATFEHCFSNRLFFPRYWDDDAVAQYEHKRRKLAECEGHLREDLAGIIKMIENCNLSEQRPFD